MKPRGIFSIIAFTNRSGTDSFRVAGTKMDGSRVRQNFATRGEALAAKQRLETETANLPAAPDLKRTQLTADQIREAENAFHRLAGRPLIDAVDFFVKNYREPLKVVRLPDAFEEFLISKTREGLRPDSLSNLRIKVGFLVTACFDANVSDIMPEHVEAVIDRPTRSPRSKDNVRRALSSFFTWSVAKGYCIENPMARVMRIKVDADEPEILAASKARVLMESAATFKDGVMLPYVTMALFCAIRPRELSRLAWRDIDLEQRTVTIGAKIAKMRGRRVVEIPENAVEWLLPHAARHTPIKGANWLKNFRKVIEAAGYGRATKEKPSLKEWTPDILRHSAISYHLSTYQNEGRTASWAGNSPDVVHRHYKGLVKPTEAAEFWQIRPQDADSKIVSMAAQ